jgi:glycosyltransferase involved in cell wall biosynthesis
MNPKLSVIVPTHDPKHLAITVQSVLDQTERDFEVVIVLNGKATGMVPLKIPSDPRIKIMAYTGPPRIGAIKQFGFMSASEKSDILVELDHDDLLAPTALEELAKAFDATKADMVYGNFAEFSEHGHVNSWDVEWGWRTRPVRILGKDLLEVVQFEPSPASLSKVYFAPHHLRAWKHEFYVKLGGHRADLEICDDHDLLCRTYLKGTMHHLDRCLYLYRRHPENTIETSQEKILQETWKIYAENIEKLVLRWCQLRGLPAIDIGRDKPRFGWKGNGEAVIGRDISQSDVGAVWADGTLNLWEDRVSIMRQIHRALVPGGWLLSRTPSASGKGAFANPLAKSHWNNLTFQYFTDRLYGRTIGNDGPEAIRFQPAQLSEVVPTQWHADNQCPYVYFDGIAIKEGYHGPGPVDI